MGPGPFSSLELRGEACKERHRMTACRAGEPGGKPESTLASWPSCARTVHDSEVLVAHGERRGKKIK
jgi:hypothetical protein